MSTEHAERWGCEWASVMAEADRMKADLPAGQNWIPRTGWDACKVMAAVGAPTSVDMIEAGGRRSAQ